MQHPFPAATGPYSIPIMAIAKKLMLIFIVEPIGMVAKDSATLSATNIAIPVSERSFFSSAADWVNKERNFFIAVPPCIINLLYKFGSAGLLPRIVTAGCEKQTANRNGFSSWQQLPVCQTLNACFSTLLYVFILSCIRLIDKSKVEQKKRR